MVIAFPADSSIAALLCANYKQFNAKAKHGRIVPVFLLFL
jgi:hypothetical protein